MSLRKLVLGISLCFLAISLTFAQLQTINGVPNQSFLPLGSADVVGSSSSVADTTLFTPGKSGLYTFNFYVAQVSGCTIVGGGSVGVQLTWTDDSPATNTDISLDALTFVTTGSLPANTINQLNSAPTTVAIYATAGNPIRYSTDYAACSAGTATYNFHATVTQ